MAQAQHRKESRPIFWPQRSPPLGTYNLAQQAGCNRTSHNTQKSQKPTTTKIKKIKKINIHIHKHTWQKGTSPSNIPQPRREHWQTIVESSNGGTSPWKPSMDLTSQLSRLTATSGLEGWIWRIWEKDWYGHVRRNMVLILLGGFGTLFALSNGFTLHRLCWVFKSQLEHCFHGHHQRPCHCQRSLGGLAQFAFVSTGICFQLYVFRPLLRASTCRSRKMKTVIIFVITFLSLIRYRKVMSILLPEGLDIPIINPTLWRTDICPSLLLNSQLPTLSSPRAVPSCCSHHTVYTGTEHIDKSKSEF